ncbi:hypothetical protein [Arthrobacter sp. ISL-30]|uniref:hypothetical protein n=1 Tax=Arthrobacter sp. ISL-30 TaxID=2819109 RepID=UPI001BED03EF|nr:hypothetical protein [Arthrobacter sp. ISL-30]MBT2515801.1 hypothetical protein [Arthrobacter sp. ISL-30]
MEYSTPSVEISDSQWWTAPQACASPSGALSTATAQSDGDVLREASRIFVSGVPGVATMSGVERERLVEAGGRMLRRCHAMAAPVSAEGWLASALPGHQGSWQRGLESAVDSAVSEVHAVAVELGGAGGEEVHPAAVGMSPDPRVAPRFPTEEQIAEVQRLFGDKSADVLRRVREYGEIDCTPDWAVTSPRVVDGTRVAMTELAPPVPPPPAPPGWVYVPVLPDTRTGTRLHAAVQRAYIDAHPDHLTVADRVVYVKGERVGGLADLAEGRMQMPERYRDGYTLLQLRILHLSLQEGRNQFPRADLTDLNTRKVFEIKPRLGTPKAVIQLWGYVTGYNTIAQFIPFPGSTPRAERPPMPYNPAAPCENPHLLSEGDWSPSPAWFSIGVGERDLQAHVFTVPQVPGVLVYDLWERRRVRSSEDEEHRIWIVDLLRLLILGGLFGGKDDDQRRDPPSGDGTEDPVDDPLPAPIPPRWAPEPERPGAFQLDWEAALKALALLIVVVVAAVVLVELLMAAAAAGLLLLLLAAA